MSASTSWDLQIFQGETPETLEAGGRAAEGYYKARGKSAKANQQNGAMDLEWVISEGPFAGVSVDKQLWNPKFSDTPEKSRQAMQHAKSIAKRCGLITDEQAKAPGMVPVDWEKIAGVERVIHVKKRTYAKRDGSAGEVTEIAYMGIYPFDHPDIPDDFRKEHPEIGAARPGAKKPPGGGGAAGGGGGGGGGNGTTPGGGGGSLPAGANTDELARSLFG